MARMIPAVVDPECSSPGEREIFSLLRDDPDTSEWVVLHSLDLANHKTQVVGEADFLVIVPGLGVLCLEVKACLAIERDRNGIWYYGRNTKKRDPRGPFKQASYACHSIRDRVSAQRPALSGILMWSAVIFPYLDFRLQTDEWQPWQAVDKRDFRVKSVGTICKDVLLSAREHLLSKKTSSWFHSSNSRPTLEERDLLCKVLRPHFEFFEVAKSRAARQSAELKRYTDLQFEVLDMMSQNRRVLCTGPAGTGKTLLSLEAVRRAATRGEKILFLCFNRRLGKFLAQETVSLGPSVTARTLHSHLLQIVGRPSPIPQDATSEYWTRELPDQAGEVLLCQRGSTWQYSYLVIDEAQDLCMDTYLDLLDLSLEGGLRNGKWMFFGDFAFQTLYGSSAGLDHLRTRSHYASVSLPDNCRNTPRIGAYATLLGGLRPDYRRYRRPDDLVEPEVQVYHSEEEQEDALGRCLEKLREAGYKPVDIVILSFKRHGIAAIASRAYPWPLAPLENADNAQVGYITIHSFKGLEAPCIILTDVTFEDSQECASLFYIGVTRALHELHILLDVRSKEAVLRVLRGKSRITEREQS
ncbi:MAG TPA: hypothetical protein EYO33_08465 [Phycisphaerales bacterium]|nr:hypothetical protein [Phycisphaerales bacterium]